MVALLTGAVMFALGLFFGWLLHRERVERRLYEDVVRTRDRATATLAETSARLELANQDLVALRAQLTDAQHLLDERDAVIAELEAELAERGRREEGDHGPPMAPAHDAPAQPTDARAEPDDREVVDDAAGAPAASEEPAAGEPLDGAADAATTPGEVQLFDDEDQLLEDEDDITEEVPLVRPSRGNGAVDAVPSEEMADAVPVDGVPSEETADAVPVDGVPSEVPADEEPRTGETVTADVPEAVDAPDITAYPTESVEDAGPGQPDDLRRINGVGPALERMLHAEGITTYRQLASLTDEAIGDLQQRAPLLVNRLRRDGWVTQARQLHSETHGDQP